MSDSQPQLIIESRPTRLIAANYDRLPFPHLSPQQEIAFDLGITALHQAVLLQGVVIKGFQGHQLLFEQRWPAPVLQKHSGESDLTIEAGSGLALRRLYFLVHGYEALSMVEITAIAKPVGGATPEEASPIQAQLQIPVVSPQYKTDLYFPLRGAWWAIQGSDWSDRHKQEVFSQTYALDFVKLGPDNQFFSGTGAHLEEHYSWGEPIYATAGGKVAYVCYDMPDLPPGAMPNPLMFRGDMRRILGNAVAISHGNGEFSYFAHLQQLSIQVNEGDLIKRGTLIGRVGNSGNSPGPHLHFHLMEGPNLFIDQGLPVKFSHFWAGGQFFEQPTFVPSRMILTGKE